MNIRELHVLALGKDEADKVDTAIPQAVFDNMLGPRGALERENVAGWYYAPEVGVFGRLLTKTECWARIKARIDKGEVYIHMMGNDITHVAKDWACLPDHVMRDEIQLSDGTN